MELLSNQYFFPQNYKEEKYIVVLLYIFEPFTPLPTSRALFVCLYFSLGWRALTPVSKAPTQEVISLRSSKFVCVLVVQKWFVQEESWWN